MGYRAVPWAGHVGGQARGKRSNFVFKWIFQTATTPSAHPIQHLTKPQSLSVLSARHVWVSFDDPWIWRENSLSCNNVHSVKTHRTGGAQQYPKLTLWLVLSQSFFTKYLFQMEAGTLKKWSLHLDSYIPSPQQLWPGLAVVFHCLQPSVILQNLLSDKLIFLCLILFTGNAHCNIIIIVINIV